MQRLGGIAQTGHTGALNHGIAVALVLARPACGPPSARRLRRLIARADTPAALAPLRDHDGPASRLVLHAAAHAFLRAADAPRAALLLLARAAKTAPRIHSLTLNSALDALLTQVPRGMQHKHDFARSTPRLVLSPGLVSHPALHLATALFVVARRLLRQWVAAALVLERLAKDYRLRRTPPALLAFGRFPDGSSVHADDGVNYTPLSPAARAHLARRLALLRLEDIGLPTELFLGLCKRMWRVLTLRARGLFQRGHAAQGECERGRAYGRVLPQHPRRVDMPLETHPADGRHDVPVQPWHTQRRVENVLQGTPFFPFRASS
ncbi:hypothetical protein C8J57DRAFT_1492150 [Mycena rebaudengoi]|nr:hypothetical protein C8J57DRAFT_1492150 [Mycena rebaudengoi]